MRLHQESQNGVHIEIVHLCYLAGFVPFKHIGLLLALKEIGIGQNLKHSFLIVELGLGQLHQILVGLQVSGACHILGLKVAHPCVEIEILAYETVPRCRSPTVEIGVKSGLIEALVEQRNQLTVSIRQQFGNRLAHIGVRELRRAEVGGQVGQSGHDVNIVVHLSEQ